MTTRTRKNALAAASATVIAAIGLLSGPAAAQARPELPLDPPYQPCSFRPSKFIIDRSDGQMLAINASGTELGNRGTIHPGRDEPIAGEGTVSGGLDGYNIEFYSAIGNDPARYNGWVTTEGGATGVVHLTDITWSALPGSILCRTSEPAPAPAPKPPPGRPNDRDSDGLFDNDETNVYGTNPDVADTDGDGPDDGQEVFDRTNPKDPNDP